MGSDKNTLVLIYALVGVATFIGMWVSVASFLSAGNGPLDFAAALAANPAVVMLTIEMTGMAVVASILMYQEAQRLEIGNPWVSIILAIIVGFGGVFPLFLALRQRRLQAELANPLAAQ